MRCDKLFRGLFCFFSPHQRRLICPKRSEETKWNVKCLILFPPLMSFHSHQSNHKWHRAWSWTAGRWITRRSNKLSDHTCEQLVSLCRSSTETCIFLLLHLFSYWFCRKWVRCGVVTGPAATSKRKTKAKKCSPLFYSCRLQDRLETPASPDTVAMFQSWLLLNLLQKSDLQVKVCWKIKGTKAARERKRAERSRAEESGAALRQKHLRHSLRHWNVFQRPVHSEFRMCPFSPIPQDSRTSLSLDDVS